MIRALAIASAIATQRLIFVPILIFVGDDEATIRWASIVAFTSAFGLHALISEVWLQRTRSDLTSAMTTAASVAARGAG